MTKADPAIAQTAHNGKVQLQGTEADLYQQVAFHVDCLILVF